MGAAVAMGGAGREQRAASESASDASGGAPMVAVAYAVMDMESAEAASAGAGSEGQRAVWATVVAATTAHVLLSSAKAGKTSKAKLQNAPCVESPARSRSCTCRNLKLSCNREVEL